MKAHLSSTHPLIGQVCENSSFFSFLLSFLFSFLFFSFFYFVLFLTISCFVFCFVVTSFLSGDNNSPASPRTGAFGAPQASPRSEEKMGEREFFRHVGK